MSNVDSSRLKQIVDGLTTTVNWAVDVLRGRDRSSKLLLLAATSFVAIPVLPQLWPFFLDGPLPPLYIRILIVVGSLAFLLALINGWRQRGAARLAEATFSTSAVKGLLPYGQDDAAIFRLLERQSELSECIRAIGDADFRIGLVLGESGNGKTSFLLAGLIPALASINHRVAYTKITERNPLDSIANALSMHATAATLDAAALLKIAGRQPGTAVVLVLDQFEQFFVHHDGAGLQVGLAELLRDWYANSERARLKLVFSLRSDFMDRFIRLQKRVGFSLGPHQSFYIDKFSPAKAAAILLAIAEREAIPCDRPFVHKIAQTELPRQRDGLISPIDLQLLVWMLTRQGETLREITEKSFQRLGGVDGLLERFLETVLRTREREHRKEVTLQVLLALADLELSARAGSLTVDEVRVRNVPALSREDALEALNWLSRSDVRLVVASQSDHDVRYELVHERVILAIRQIAGTNLRELDRMNQLLERRVNEWMGNDQHARFLLRWGELRAVLRQQSKITWGPKQAAKEKLVSRSRRRIIFLQMTGAMLVVVAIGGQLAWWSAPVQIRLIQNDVKSYADRLPTAAMLKVYSKMTHPTYGLPILLNAVHGLGDAHSDAEKCDVLTGAISAAGVNADRRTTALFHSVVEASQKIKEREFRVAVLAQVASYIETLADDHTAVFSSIEAALAELSEEQRTDILAGAVESVVVMEDPGVDLSKVLPKLLAAVAELQSDTSKMAMIEAVAKGVERRDTRGSDAEAVAKKALEWCDSVNSKDLATQGCSSLAMAYAPHWRELALAAAAAAVTSARFMDSSEDKDLTVYLLRELQEKHQVISTAGLLRNAIQLATSIQDSDEYKSNSIANIAHQATYLTDMQATQDLLNLLLTIAEPMPTPSERSDAFSYLVGAGLRVQDGKWALDYVKRILARSKGLPMNLRFDVLSSTSRCANTSLSREDCESFLFQKLRDAPYARNPDNVAYYIDDVMRSAALLQLPPASAAKLRSDFLPTFQGIKSPFRHTEAAVSFATYLVESGDRDGAADFFMEQLGQARAADAMSLNLTGFRPLFPTIAPRVKDPESLDRSLRRAYEFAKSVPTQRREDYVEWILRAAGELLRTESARKLFETALLEAGRNGSEGSEWNPNSAIAQAAGGANGMDMELAISVISSALTQSNANSYLTCKMLQAVSYSNSPGTLLTALVRDSPQVRRNLVTHDCLSAVSNAMRSIAPTEARELFESLAEAIANGSGDAMDGGGIHNLLIDATERNLIDTMAPMLPVVLSRTWEERNEAQGITAVIEASAKLSKPQTTFTTLNHALTVAKSVGSETKRAAILIAVAKIAADLKDRAMGADFLQQVLSLSPLVNSEQQKDLLDAGIESAAKLGEVRLARQYANRHDRQADTALGMASILANFQRIDD